MSCGCENKRLASEYGRITRLAKALAVMDDTVVAVYMNPDGTYGFVPESVGTDRRIIEYITPY